MTLGRSYALLWLASFCSTFGSALVVMTLSIKVLADTGSGLLAGGIYASQWLLPVVLLPVVGWMAAKLPVRGMLVHTQVVSAAVTVGVGWAFPGHIAVFALLMTLRGFLESVTKTGTAVALKIHVDPGKLQAAAPYYEISRYIASGAASLSGLLLIERLTVFEIVVVDAVSYAIAALCYAVLPHRDAVSPRAPLPTLAYWAQTWRIIRSDHVMTVSFVFLMLSAFVYQGYYYVGRTALPLEYFHMTQSETAGVQVFISIAFIAASVVVGRWLRPDSPLRRWATPLPMATVTSAFLAGSVLTTDPLLGVSAFLVFLFCYEVIYSFSVTTLLTRCRPEDVGHIAAARNGSVTLAVVLGIGTTGVLVDAVQLEWAALCLACLGIVGTAVVLRITRRPVPPRPESLLGIPDLDPAPRMSSSCDGRKRPHTM